MCQLNQQLCIPSIHDESVKEIWFDTVSHVERLKREMQSDKETLIISFSSKGPFEPIHLQLGASHVVHHKTHGLVFDAQRGKLLSYLACENETDDTPENSSRVEVAAGGVHTVEGGDAKMRTDAGSNANAPPAESEVANNLTEKTEATHAASTGSSTSDSSSGWQC